MRKVGTALLGDKFHPGDLVVVKMGRHPLTMGMVVGESHSHSTRFLDVLRFDDCKMAYVPFDGMEPKYGVEPKYDVELIHGFENCSYLTG